MVDEKNILIHINEKVYNLLLTLIESKSSLLEIKSDIHDLNNNFFLEDKDKIYEKLITIFDDNAFNNLIQDLTQYNNLIITKIDNCCNHEWIQDLIDVDCETSQTIIYCKLCEVSKKI